MLKVRWLRMVLITLALMALGLGPVHAQTKIVMLHWEGPQSPLQTGIKIFEEQNPNIDVELIAASPYNDKIYTMSAGDVPFDVLYVSADMYLEWVRQGLLMDITGLIEKDPVLGRKGFFLPIEAHRAAIEGKWYGIGSSWSNFVVYYNRDLFAASGLTPLPRRAADAWSWDDYRSVAQKLVRSNGAAIERYGASRPTWWLVLQSLFLSNNGDFLNPEGTRFRLDQPEPVRVLEAVGEGIGSRLFGGSLAQGTAAMSIDGSWSTGASYANVRFELGVGVLPAFVRPTTYAQGHLHAIHARTKHVQEAWRLLKFLYTKEYLGMWVRAGYWLPNTTQMMTPSAFNEFHNPDFMPEDYLEFAVTYLQEAGKARTMPVGWGKALQVFEQRTAKMWSGEQSVRAVLDGAVPAMNEILRDSQRIR